MNVAWYIARASGIVSWALLAGSLICGLCLSGRVRRPGRGWTLDLHRFLGGLSVVFVGVHLVALVADSYVEFGALELFVPLASEYRPVAVALGVVAFYLLVAIELTSLGMRSLPRRLWRWVHLTSYGLYVLGTAHLLLAGTDASNPVVYGVVAAASVGIAGLTAMRIASARRPARSAVDRRAAVGVLDETSRVVGRHAT